jgi:hypothetical protein
MNARNRRLALLAAAPIALAGCGAAQATSQSAASTQPAAGMSMAPGMSMEHGTLAATGPSDSAKMICAPETQHNLAMLLGLHAPPHSVASWEDHVYTCTYHLAQGPLVLSVTESASDAAARRYFSSLQAGNGQAHALRGLESLGLPAFETSDGTVAFVKDNMTLQVDATRLPPQVGAKRSTPTSLAYTLATDVLGCWNGD